MVMAKEVFVKCRFTRGGFGHDRVFWIPTPDNSGEYRGVAFIGYCFRRDRTPLRPEEPPPGQSLDGLVVARVVRVTDGVLTVQVPDGELCDIDPSIVEDPKDVLVGS